MCNCPKNRKRPKAKKTAPKAGNPASDVSTQSSVPDECKTFACFKERRKEARQGSR